MTETSPSDVIAARSATAADATDVADRSRLTDAIELVPPEPGAVVDASWLVVDRIAVALEAGDATLGSIEAPDLTAVAASAGDVAEASCVRAETTEQAAPPEPTVDCSWVSAETIDVAIPARATTSTDVTETGLT